jgi:meiotic recombination protein REC8, fungi type
VIPMEVHFYTSRLRPDTVTIKSDPAMTLGLNMDDFLGVSNTKLHPVMCVDTAFHQDWEDILKAQGLIRSRYVHLTVLTYTEEDDGSDDEYGKPKKSLKSRDKHALPHPEVGRTARHTLDENLEQMMSGSFDVSFPSGTHGEQDSFSSNIDAGFDFGNNEDFGLGDIGDELVKELGEGWTSAPVQQKFVFSY